MDSDHGLAAGDRFVLSKGVRARPEAFGLLFYNSTDAKMTFVKSGDLLAVEKHTYVSRLTVNCKKGEEQAAKRVLEVLLKKGLICEAGTYL
jgi:putative mycofactocin binding protein MftB